MWKGLRWETYNCSLGQETSPVQCNRPTEHGGGNQSSRGCEGNSQRLAMYELNLIVVLFHRSRRILFLDRNCSRELLLHLLLRHRSIGHVFNHSLPHTRTHSSILLCSIAETPLNPPTHLLTATHSLRDTPTHSPTATYSDIHPPTHICTHSPTPDNFWVPSHRFNSATGEQKGPTDICTHSPTHSFTPSTHSLTHTLIHSLPLSVDSSPFFILESATYHRQHL